MTQLADLHLVLFFTQGMSLRQWARIGMLEREVALYKGLERHLARVSFVTYGDRSDADYVGLLPGINIICNAWRLPQRWYLQYVRLRLRRIWSARTIVKSNQVLGSDSAAKVAGNLNSRFVARCGYLYSDFMEKRHGCDSPMALQARELERSTFGRADQVIVTSEAMREMVLERYNLEERRVQVIPNYVDTDLFYWDEKAEREDNELLFIGRLEKQKNVLALVEALQGLNIRLRVVGEGPLRESIGRLAEEKKVAVEFLGNRPHAELPVLMNRSGVFVLPSLYEGHPKVLIEAMACGAPVIGTNVDGIRELIRHKETGYLCDTSRESIRDAVRAVLGDGELRRIMSSSARRFAESHFCLPRVIELELNALQTAAIHKRH